ncbi:retrovirus-related pol polyprotein from transposon TNT 1-94 [Tanacetum coccineum]
MFGTVPPISPPLDADTGNTSSPNRVDTMPTNNINNTTTNNVAQNVVDENLPQLLNSRGGSHVTNVHAFDIEDFSSWKDRFMVYLDGLEPYLLEILKDGPFVPLSSLSTSTNPLPKPQKQLSHANRRLANQDKILKSIIISCLPNDVMKSVIKCITTKAMWNDLILAHEQPSDTRDTKIAALRLKFNAFNALEGDKVNGTFTRLKCLLNDLENNGVSIPQDEVNATFVNSLPRKWLSMNQTQRANNSIKNDSLATLYGKYNYEEGLIDQIYESETSRFTILASRSKALISNSQVQDIDSDVEDQRSSSEFLADLNAEFHERALLANQKRFYKRSGRVGSAKKPMDKVKYKGLKAKIVILTKKIDAMSKGKSEYGLVAESFDWYEESVSSDDEGVTKVEAFMAIAEDEPYVGKADVRKHVLDYTHVDLHYVEDQRKNLLSKFNSFKQELSSYNDSLMDEVSDLKKVTEKWTSSKGTLDQLLNEQVTESTSKTVPKITNDFESECDNLEPLPPLLKLIGAEPIGTSADVPDKRSAVKAPKKRAQTVLPSVPDPIPIKKADLSTEQLLLTLIEEVKGLEEQIKTPLDNSTSVSQTWSSKSVKGKQKTWFGPYKHYGFRNHLLEDCFIKPKCSTCGSTDHLTKEHLEQAAIKKTLAKLKAQSSQGSSSKKTPMIPKPFIDCKYCRFNDHHSDECEYYPGCDICGSITHETVECTKKPSSNNKKPGLLISDLLNLLKQKKPIILKSPKVVFGDNSSGDTEGYGSVNCNGITFTRVAYVNGLKHNLISISQLCDANFKVLFIKTQGTIFNQNNKVVLIAPRRRDVYVIDMSSYIEESNACFFAKAILSVNWLWHKRLSHLIFKNINKLVKQNLVAGLPSLTFSKDKTCLTCEKGKHPRASFKTKRSFSINKKMENLNEVRVKALRSDNGTEFRNHKLDEFYDEKGIS